jgi:hypothetical protein
MITSTTFTAKANPSTNGHEFRSKAARATNDQEQYRVDNEDDGAPKADELRAGNRQEHPRPIAVHINAGRDDGEHAGESGALRGQVGQKRQRDGNDALQLRIVDATPQRDCNEPRQAPDRERACDGREQVDGDAAKVKGPGGGDRDRGRVDYQRSRVVQQALALDDRDNVARQPEILKDRDGRQLVGRRDDGAQHEGDGPGHRWVDRVCDDRHTDSRREDQHDNQQADLPCVFSHRIGGRGDRPPVKQRREEQDEDQPGIEWDGRQTRDEAQHEAAQHQHDRIRDLGTLRERDERDDAQKQRDQQAEVQSRSAVPRQISRHSYLRSNRKDHLNVPLLRQRAHTV